MELTDVQEEVTLEADSDDRTIWDRALTKRRRTLHLQPDEIVEIFPNLGPMMVCQLSERVTCSPSEIYEAVPGASTKQIGAFFKLV